MPRKCTICVHPQRKRIERAFIAGHTYRTITERHGVSMQAIIRHITHTARMLLSAARDRDAVKVRDLADIAAEALTEAKALLDDAKKGDDLSCPECNVVVGRLKDRKAWAAAVTAMQRHVEVLGRLEGRIKDTQVIVVLDTPEWRSVEDRIFAALESMPKARDLVARELMQLEAGR